MLVDTALLSKSSSCRYDAKLTCCVCTFRSRVFVNGKLKSYRVDNEDGSSTKRFYVYASESLSNACFG